MAVAIGSHGAKAEGDVFILTVIEDVSLENAQQIFAFADEIIEQHGRFGCLMDMRKMGHISPEARHFVGRWPGFSGCYGLAMVGGSFASRTLITLLIRAIGIFSKHSPSFSFFKTEEEARTWLLEQRKVIQLQQA